MNDIIKLNTVMTPHTMIAMACMVLSLVSNDNLSHLNGFRFQETMYGNEVSKSIERNGGESDNGCFDMH